MAPWAAGPRAVLAAVALVAAGGKAPRGPAQNSTDQHRSAFQCRRGKLSCSTAEEWCAHKEAQCVHVRCKCVGGVGACSYEEASLFRPIGSHQCNLTVAATARSRSHHRHYTAGKAAKAAKKAAKKVARKAPKEDPPGFKNDAYVELRSDPTAGGFLRQEPGGGWSVWPRMGGKSFEGFLGYGYKRVRADGGRVAKDIDPEEWDIVPFPVARTGPADGGDSFFTDGDRTHRGDYSNLVGKTFRFTIGGLGGLDCGCNANFYAVRMGAGCDGSGNNGDLCEEIDFFEGNKFAWHSTLHTLADSGETDANGLCTGYGGTLPTKPNFPSFDGNEYGPDGTMIDTEKDFHVAVSFPKGKNGKLKGMCVELSQEGKPSMEQPLFMHLYAYEGSFYTEPGGGGGLKVENGMDKVERRMNDGVTMLSSLWSGGMRWLDGAASEHGDNNIMDGKCTGDGECSGYTVSGISVEDIPEPTQAPTEAPREAAAEGATDPLLPWVLAQESPTATAAERPAAAGRGPAAAAPAGFEDDAYVELRSDPMAGGFLKKEAGGAWSVWPRRGGRTFKGFVGYGYNRTHAKGGRVAQDIDLKDWDLVPFPVARTGPADGGDSFWTDGDRTHRGDYSNLVGKTFRFTIGGLGGLDCGCNANFYAVRAGAGCDGSGNNGDLCEEIDFFEGNKFAWHSTLHTLADSGETDSNGLCTGYGGTLPTKPNFPSFDGEEYGPEGTMIDTEKDFHVAVSFPRRGDGRLKGMCVELSQEGKPSMEQPLFMHLYAYEGSLYSEPGGGGGLKVENGMDKVETRMNEGVTMLSSLWSGGMRWLDGAASEHGDNNIMDGKCTYDGDCSGYSISGIAVEDIVEPASTIILMK